MDVTILGCAGTFPSATSGCSAYLVRHDGFTLLVDAGNGAVGALQRAAGLFDVDAVILSHLHADHCVDLVAYSYARRYYREPLPVLPLYGPLGTQDRLVRIFDAPPKDGLEEVFDFRTTSAGRLGIGPFDVSLTETAHPVECHSIRLEAGGRTLVYSADTGPSDAVVASARDADLFLCESTWLSGSEHPPNLHMTAWEAGEHAARSGARRLVLVHTTAWMDQSRFVDEAASAYDGPVALARAGATYAV